MARAHSWTVHSPRGTSRATASPSTSPASTSTPRRAGTPSGPPATVPPTAWTISWRRAGGPPGASRTWSSASQGFVNSVRPAPTRRRFSSGERCTQTFTRGGGDTPSAAATSATSASQSRKSRSASARGFSRGKWRSQRAPVSRPPRIRSIPARVARSPVRAPTNRSPATARSAITATASPPRDREGGVRRRDATAPAAPSRAAVQASVPRRKRRRRRSSARASS